MKEQRFFYDEALKGELPEEEARHAVRVLRLREGDVIWLMDGRGSFCEAVITTASNHHCLYYIVKELPQQRQWDGHLHLVIAPTKMMDRMEWMVEKAVEIGVDEVSFVRCENSERTELKTERLRRIALSAVKQSRKAWMPQINEMKDFSKVVSEIGEGDAVFICHCHEGKKEHLNALLQRNRELLKDNEEQSIYVFVGPEGDFSEKEVKEVMSRGAVAASLGESRLRTETAGLVAVHLMHLNYEKQA